jgi:ribosomal protein S25
MRFSAPSPLKPTDERLEFEPRTPELLNHPQIRQNGTSRRTIDTSKRREEDADCLKGTTPNRRQEAKEEVVQGQGYVIPQRAATAPLHTPRIPSGRSKRSPTYTRTRSLTTRIATNSRVVKDKAQHDVVLTKEKNDRIQKDVQSYRLITVATLVDRLKINGSLARQVLKDLETNGQIKKVVGHSKLNIFSTLQHKLRVIAIALKMYMEQWLTHSSTSDR